MIRRLTVALAFVLVLVLAAAAPVAGKYRGVFAQMQGSTTPSCWVGVGVSWSGYPDQKDYQVQVVFYEDGVPNVVMTSGAVGGTGTWTPQLTGLYATGPSHTWSAVASLLRYGPRLSNAKVVAEQPSNGYISLTCSANPPS
jgi:hypothetical protein